MRSGSFPGEQRQDLHARPEAHHFAQQLVGLIAVRRYVQEDQVRRSASDGPAEIPRRRVVAQQVRLGARQVRGEQRLQLFEHARIRADNNSPSQRRRGGLTMLHSGALTSLEMVPKM